VDFLDFLVELWESTGIMGFLAKGGGGKLIMIAISLLLIWLAIAKGFEPLLLIPIGFGEYWLIYPVQA
jgi:Na+-transporting methylmalonyl-CoA/oxaloacetate decarboxylase beta subunit